MKSRTRIEAALALDIADRPPFGSWGHSYRDEWSPRQLAEATLDTQRRFGWDFVKFQPRATCFAEAFGSMYRPSGNRLEGPVLVEPAIRKAEDWSSLPKVDASAPPLAEQVAGIGMVASRLGPDTPVIQTVFSPLTIADYLLGRGPLAIVQEEREQPDLIATALDQIADAMIDFAGRSIEAGAAGIFFAISGYASRDAIPIDVYSNLFLTHDQKVLNSLTAAAWFNVVHLCRSNIHFDLIDSLQSQAVSWSVHDSGNPTLEEGIKRSGRAAVGGLGQATTLIQGPPEAIVQEVKSAASANGGRGVIVAPGCSVPPEAPEEHLKLIVEALT